LFAGWVQYRIAMPHLISLVETVELVDILATFE
jgi:hypothetical protein